MDETRLKKLETQFQQVLKLCELQRTLRTAVQTRLAEDKLTIGQLAARINISWQHLKDFLAGKKALAYSRSLQPLIEYANLSELAPEIIQQSKSLPDKLIGLTVLSPELITFAFKLQREYLKTINDLNMEEFASAFGANASAVLGTIYFSIETIKGISHDTMFQIASLIHSSELINTCQALIVAKARERDRMSRHLMKLTTLLRPHHSSVPDLARALGVGTTNFHQALRGTPSVGLDTYKLMIKNAEVILKQKSVPTVLTGPSPPSIEITPDTPLPKEEPQAVRTRGAIRTSAQRVNSSSTPAPPTLSGVIDQFGGGTSPLGVNHVLDEKSFKDLEVTAKEGVTSFLRSVASHLETSRALINIILQIKDPSIRRQASELVGPQLSELLLSGRAWGLKNPMAITPSLDVERQVWLTQKQGSKTQNGK